MEKYFVIRRAKIVLRLHTLTYFFLSKIVKVTAKCANLYVSPKRSFKMEHLPDPNIGEKDH